MAAILGTATVLRVNGTTVAKGTSLAMTRPTNMVDVTNKDSAGNQEVLPGMRSASYQFDGIYDPAVTTGAGFALLFGLQTAGTLVTAIFGPTSGGDRIYTASCFISSLSMAAPSLDKQTYSCTLTVTGAVVEAAS